MKVARKVRHPHQILDKSEMVVGERYAFVSAFERCNSIHHFVMGGTFDDSYSHARHLGHDLDSKPRIWMLFPGAGEDDIATIHMDGLRPDCGDKVIATGYGATLVCWRDGCAAGWEFLCDYLGPEESPSETVGPFGYHLIIVPGSAWEDDPRLHSSFWSDPNVIVRRACEAESPADWESMMRARTHEAMARALGF